MTCTDKAAEIRDDLRVGDRVGLVGEVVKFGEGAETALVRFDCYERWLTTKFVRSGRRVARPLGIGDRVKFKQPSDWSERYIGKIVAVEDDEVYVNWNEAPQINAGPPNARQFRDSLERAPAPDTKEGT